MVMYTLMSETHTVNGYHRLASQSLSANSLTCPNEPWIGLGSASYSLVGPLRERSVPPNLNISTKLNTISVRYFAANAEVKPAKGSLNCRIMTTEMTLKITAPSTVE